MSEEIFNITLPLVKKLIAQQFPEFAHLSIQPVKIQGHDNRTFRFGTDMSIRMPSAEAYALKVPKEQTLLPKLKTHLTTAIPVPLKMGQPSTDYPFNFSIYQWLEGESANEIEMDDKDLECLATALAKFLKELQSINTTDGPKAGLHNWWRGAHISVYDEQARCQIESLKDIIDSKNALALWEIALKIPWQNQPVWIHGDLASSNILIKGGKLSGIIDFGGLGIGDPACDLVIAWTFLKGKAREIFKQKVNLDTDTWIRAQAWCIWKATYELCQQENKSSLLAMQQKHIIEEVLNEFKRNHINITFKHAKKSQRDLIHQWLKQDYIQQWIHGQGLQNTLNGLEKFYAYQSKGIIFNLQTEITQHWLGYDNDKPFVYLLTSNVFKNTEDAYAKYCELPGAAITLDIFIGDPEYVGKGLAATVIKEFLLSQFSTVSEVLIDPEQSNARAVHVYQKAGFKIIDEYIAPWHPAPHYIMKIKMKDL